MSTDRLVGVVVPWRPLDAPAKLPSLRATVSSTAEREADPSGHSGLEAKGLYFGWSYMSRMVFSQPASAQSTKMQAESK